MGRTSDARDRLLDSAAELFHERGYTAVGVSDICRTADVNKGSFYHFFPSKQELALAVVDAYWFGMRDRLEQHLQGTGPALERLRSFCTALYRDHARTCDATGTQRGCPLGNLALEMSTQDPRLRDRMRQVFDAQIGYFERLFEEARDGGELARGGDCRTAPRRAAESLVALMEGRILLSKVRNDAAPLAGLYDDTLRLLGVEPPAADPGDPPGPAAATAS